MSQVKKMSMTVLLLALGLLMLAGCGDQNSKSVFDAETGTHLAGWVPSGHAVAAKADANSCTQCHGSDFSGGISASSCSKCHASGSPLAFTNCTSCHGTPPTGTVAPNRNGAHAAHSALPGMANVCTTCHAGAETTVTTTNHFNGSVDVQLLSLYNAKSGTAVRNADGTCSNVSCHGGQPTPVWLAGTINVNSDCTACHSFGSIQFNGVVSGHHSYHVITLGYSCLTCHDTVILAANHFTSLNTSVMEGPASATINGVLISSYSNGTCTTLCHESRSW